MVEEGSFVERCWFIFGFRFRNLFIGIIVKHSIGSFGGVDFDWRQLLEYETLESKRLIGFFHTHPNQMMQYSSIDVTTMKAWNRSMGRDLICGIWNEERNKERCHLFCSKMNNKKRYYAINKMKTYWDKFIYIGKA